jgi:hypothetical protein
MFNDKFYPLKIIISGDFYFHRVLAGLPSFFSDTTLTEKGSICLWCDATRLNMFEFHLHEGVRQDKRVENFGNLPALNFFPCLFHGRVEWLLRTAFNVGVDRDPIKMKGKFNPN